MLAPLAGVSDHPFRRVCASLGADLTYVEMISATAMLYQSKRTYEMLERHPEESVLGVQLTGKSAQELGEAIVLLDNMPFDTIDINMGCPVKKIVAQGCGSAVLRDPQLVYQYVSTARSKTSKPLSVKIRLGWDRPTLNVEEVVRAISDGGADWITIHGRCRSEDYSFPVDLENIEKGVLATDLPVVGNGNLFCMADLTCLKQHVNIQGAMISRGALGNPWVFKSMRAGVDYEPTFKEWLQVVLSHIEMQREAYGEHRTAAVCMRKHLLWYTKGWEGSKKLRKEMQQVESLEAATTLLTEFANNAIQNSTITDDTRRNLHQESSQNSFIWDPKWEMDRRLDRGVGAIDPTGSSQGELVT